MSYTTSSETTAAPTTPSTDQSNQDDFVAKVVSAKGDQWSNPQEVAKGYLASQDHITNLENQAKEMRTELDKQDYAKVLLEKLQEQSKPTIMEAPVLKTNDGVTQEPTTTPQRSEDELKNLMKEMLTQNSQEDLMNSNRHIVDEKLQALYGTEVEANMAKKSIELGLSKDRLIALAGESPEAFFRMIGETAPVKETNKTTHGSVNTSAAAFDTTNPGARNWSYYETIRKSNKKLYFTAKVQQQMFADKLAQGAAFGN